MPPELLRWWALTVLGVVLVVAAVFDARRGVIPKAVTYPSIAVGLIGHTLAGGLYGGPDPLQLGLLGSLAGLAVGFLPMFALFLIGGIGGGDVKLMAGIGALAGWRFTLEAMFFGFAVAVVMSLIVLLRRRRTRETFARIFRFLWIVASLGKPADPATAESPKIPFGVALCVGSALALAAAVIRGPAGTNFLGV